ncbi:TIGR03571 family LLM class oxidoreductase [Pedobacter hiemivivus]|uniref:TIGR03571 family LLM class oxidoreductase n=1 Tax=Pedobacter hiemivivus TaxID=2530454 RepID=A0A4R0NHG1_9SPHI|nr:TIGR03571 family LLM class oxidoreductase [Pedobacter hiemivivus]TCC99648.1 TIGR03571 family LLM class oxidoreductase [Pedobacter hiemivivus]
MNRLDKIGKSGELTIGLEFPLDNDWSAMGDQKRKQDGRPFGVPDIANHSKLAQLADELGFAALWMRDVPVYDPNFGDAAQQFEAFSYLGYLSALTKNIMLGTAAIVLPLRKPILVAKSAASIDLLSNGRLMLGLGLGDRAVEFPMFGYNYEDRAERFRSGVELMKHVWKKNGYLDNLYPELGLGMQVFPKPTQESVPLVMAGHGQQSIEWIAANMQAWFNYPRNVMETKHQATQWTTELERAGLGHKPYITAFHLKLEADPDASVKPHRFGAALGRNALIDLLKDYQTAGVNHMALQLRHSSRPLDEVMSEISQYVLPIFR